MQTIPKNRDENLLINHEEFCNGSVQLASLPPVLFVELTQNCNLSCFMCRSAKGYQKNLNMTDEIFKLLQKELFPYASIVDLRGYGESTILKDFEDRVRQTVQLVPRIRLVTNALSIKTSLWKLLMETGSSVVVSVDAANKETMEFLGRGSFDKLLTSLEIGSKERERVDCYGNISFNTVVSSMNLEELKDIVLLAKRFGVKRITMFPVVVKRNNPLSIETKKLELVKYLKEAEDAAISNDIELRLGASVDEGLVVQEGLPSRCSHPWEYCYIDYAGNVGYCDHLIGHTALMFGSLKEKSFQEIWNGIEFQELRNIHSKAKRGGTSELSSLFPHCNWCYKRRYVDFEDETNSEAKTRIISTSNRSLPLMAVSNCDVISNEFLSGRKLPHINVLK